MENFLIKSKTIPFQHQIDGVKFGTTHTSWLLADSMGLGKSRQAIDIGVYNKEHRGYKHCLIVCGINSLKWNWYNEITTHSYEAGYILGQRTNRKGKITIGSIKQRIEDLKRITELPYFLITNIESFRDTEFATLVKNLCKTEIQMCVIDEAHTLRTPTCQQTKGFLSCNTEYKLAMTGTPIMNRPLDLYSILKWLGYESHNYYAFKNHYCVMGGFGGHEIVGYRHLDQLSNITRNIMLRRLKEDVLDLPEKIYVDEIVEMTNKQSKLYDDVLKSIMDNIDKIRLSRNLLVSIVRLRQCTGFTGILSSEIQESAKLDRLVELVEEASINNSKCIVYSNWTQITDIVVNRLKKFNPAYITGAVSEEKRNAEKQRFNTDPNCMCIVGTISSMSTGHNLQAATTVIFLDHPWTRAAYDQAVDRAHRIGQTKNITVYNLMCKDTIDYRVWQIMNRKGVMSEAMLDNPINNLNMLEFLLH